MPVLYASSGAKGTAWLSDRRARGQLAREIYRAFHAHPVVLRETVEFSLAETTRYTISAARTVRKLFAMH